MPERENTLSILLELLGPDIVREGAREMRVMRALEQRRSGEEAALARCVASFEVQFGKPSDLHREDFECLGAKSLALTNLLIERSENLRAFNDVFALVAATFVEGKRAGARQVLVGMLERRFGSLNPLHALAISVADGAELNRCFDRLSRAESVLDVLAPLLDAAEGKRADR